ncbi:MAG: hypothetical protein N2746_06405 [Deltaproteobacteria bacterium]|nr:hypothetical protein [Deltaproteobacteria bacterium]
MNSNNIISSDTHYSYVNPDYSTSENDMYSSYYNYQKKGEYVSNPSSKIRTYEHSEKVKNLIPNITEDDIDKSKCKDEHEYNAKLALVASFQKLRKLLNDPLISDETSLIIYNMLITYIEYKGEWRANETYGANEDHGLDDIISYLKSKSSYKEALSGDWNSDQIIDSKGYRELVTTIEVALKKIKEDTNIEFPDQKRNHAMSYFVGNSALVDYYAEKEDKE